MDVRLENPSKGPSKMLHVRIKIKRKKLVNMDNPTLLL